jgi:hypothetical protein
MQTLDTGYPSRHLVVDIIHNIGRAKVVWFNAGKQLGIESG